jgi:hypothetical protein
MTIRGGVVALAIGAALASPMSAWSDDVLPVSSLADDPVGAVTSTADGATGAVVSTASGALGAAATSTPIPNATDGAGPGGATSSPSAGTGSDEGASRGTEASRGKAHRAGSTARPSPGRFYHSRFDRLPRRTELLLERIELGRHVQTNLRRLQALLVRFPGLRARLERALDAELARLHRGGLTQTEREQVRRLARIREALGTRSASFVTAWQSWRGWGWLLGGYSGRSGLRPDNDTFGERIRGRGTGRYSRISPFAGQHLRAASRAEPPRRMAALGRLPAHGIGLADDPRAGRRPRRPIHTDPSGELNGAVDQAPVTGSGGWTASACSPSFVASARRPTTYQTSISPFPLTGIVPRDSQMNSPSSRSFVASVT